VTIGQVAKAAGISASAIRYYESSGVLPKPGRKNGIRQYDSSSIQQLKVLRFYRSSGVSVDSLASMFLEDKSARRKNRHQAVLRRIDELDRAISQARSMRRRLQGLLNCGCKGDLKKCVIFL